MWLEILTVAFVAQLAVLPGEKVQFIIAGLSTRYNPLVVVAAAGSAFAGWTVLEILFGRALQRALSPVVLDSLTAGLFLLFAVLLYRSAPGEGDAGVADRLSAETDGRGGVAETDGGVAASVELPFGIELDGDGRLGAFVPIFAMMAAGEFGDKTQLVTIGLAAQYGAHPAIWAGEMLAIIPVSLANAFFFHRFSHRFDVRKAHLAGAALFAFFGLDTVLAVLTGFSVWETAVEAVSAAVPTLA
jgi:putative Ca2+/H+ antiporter (TMEM165/GDT1 family)